MKQLKRRSLPGLLGAMVLTLASLVWVQPASAAVPGLQRIVESKASNSVSPTSATATCPPGKRVIGTGAQISGGQGQVIIDDVTPNAALTSVIVTGYEDADGFGGNWTVTAIAVCANPLPGLRHVSDTEGPNSVDGKFANAECPGSQKPIGVGAEITGGLGRVTMEGMRGVTSPGFPTSGAQGFETNNGTNASWSVTSHLICADSALPGQRISSEVTAFDSLSKGVTASCGSDKVVSTGFSLVQGSGEVIVDNINPLGGLASVRVGATEDQNGQSAVWSIRSWAVCATP